MSLFLRRGSGLQSTFRATRTYTATDRGRIIGIRFLPGAFYAFWPGRLVEVIDKTLDIRVIFPEFDKRYIAELLLLGDYEVLAKLAELVRSRHTAPDPNIDMINTIITAPETDTSLQTVKAVAQHFHKSERWLQQLFRDYTGIGLKWLLQRNKLLIAAQHIRDTSNPNWGHRLRLRL